MADYSPIIIAEIQAGRDLAESLQTEANALSSLIMVEANKLAYTPLAAPALPTLSAVQYDFPTPPDVQSALDGIAFPEAPAEPSISTDIGFSLPAQPDDYIEFPSVDFNSNAPSAFDDEPPSEPGDLLPINIPDSPTLDFPSPPSVGSIIVPDIPTLDLPQFTATLADVPGAPDTSFAWSEDIYSSDLLTSLRTLVQEWIDGAATGIDPVVEEAIWNRGRDREYQTYAAALDQIAGDFAARGFALPPGAAAQLADQAIQKAREAAGNVNRDIIVKAADLEQSNRQFAMNLGWQVEAGLIQYWSQQAARSFDAAKYLVEAAIAVYGARVQGYNAEVQAFTARASVYKTQIEGELAKLEIFKSQIEAQRLNVALTEQAVNVYRAQLEGLRTIVELYNAQVTAATAVAETNKVQIEGYKARVEAYGERVKAKSLEYQAYDTSIRAEVSKLEVPKIQAEVFKARTDAYGTQVRAQTEQANLQIKVQSEVPLEIYKAQTEAFRSSVQAVAEQVRAIASAYETQARVYDTQVKAESASVDAEVKLQEATASIAESQSRVNIETERNNANVYIEIARLKTEAARSEATIVAQLAAGAAAGMSLAASLSQSGSDAKVQSASISASTSANTSATAGTSTSTSTSSSTSNVNQTSLNRSESRSDVHIHNYKTGTYTSSA